MVLDLTREYNFPIAFDFPIGHTSENQTVICGANVEFELNENGGVLKFSQNPV